MNVTMTSKMVAEMLGTMVLVLMGCGAAVIAGADGTTGVGLLGIAFAFGLSVVAMAYAIGHISGCHINPAISVAMFAAGRMKAKEAGMYVVSQIAGAILGTAIGAAAYYFNEKGKNDVARTIEALDEISASAQNTVDDLASEVTITDSEIQK